LAALCGGTAAVIGGIEGMASEEDCEQALHRLADRLAANGTSERNRGFDRSLSCTVRDLGIVFGGRLRNGQLQEIRRVSTAGAQIRLALTSDDLLRLVDGELALPAAWASGRIKIDAGMLDLMKLRTIF
jgi:hypothetical protein